MKMFSRLVRSRRYTRCTQEYMSASNEAFEVQDLPFLIQGLQFISGHGQGTSACGRPPGHGHFTAIITLEVHGRVQTFVEAGQGGN